VKHFFARLWHEQDGVLSFEWTVLASLLTVGVVAGIASVRDAVTDEMGDLSQAMVQLDQSYYIEPPLGIRVHTVGGAGGRFGFGGSAASGSQFIDFSSYQDCYRADSHLKLHEFPRRDASGTRIQPPAVRSRRKNRHCSESANVQLVKRSASRSQRGRFTSATHLVAKTHCAFLKLLVAKLDLASTKRPR